MITNISHQLFDYTITFVYQRALIRTFNTSFNNVFLEDGEILKVGRSPEVPWSLPNLPPPTAFFSWGRNILFQISGGAYSQGGHMPHLF